MRLIVLPTLFIFATALGCTCHPQAHSETDKPPIALKVVMRQTPDSIRLEMEVENRSPRDYYVNLGPVRPGLKTPYLYWTGGGTLMVFQGLISQLEEYTPTMGSILQRLEGGQRLDYSIEIPNPVRETLAFGQLFDPAGTSYFDVKGMQVACERLVVAQGFWAADEIPTEAIFVLKMERIPNFIRKLPGEKFILLGTSLDRKRLGDAPMDVVAADCIRRQVPMSSLTAAIETEQFIYARMNLFPAVNVCRQ